MQSGMFKHSLQAKLLLSCKYFMAVFYPQRRKEKKKNHLISKSHTYNAWSNILLLLCLHE